MNRRAGGTVSLVIAAALLVAAASRGPDLVPVPRPALGAADEAVRQQITETLESLEDLQRDPMTSAQALAAAYGQLGRLGILYELYGMAAAALTNSHRLEPGSFAWPYYLAVIDERTGDADAAARRLRQALELKPNDVAALVRLGRIELRRQQLEGAETAFRTALQAASDSAAALDGLAQAAEARGDLEGAADLYERVLEIQPSAPAVRYRLGMVYRELGRLEAARAMLADSGSEPVAFPDPLMGEVERSGAGTGIHMVRGSTASVEGEHAEAVGHYRRAVAADPDDLQARKALASALAEAGRLDEALAGFRWILERHPEDPVAHYNVGTIYARRGDAATAADHFRAAVEADPEYGNALLNLALALEATGRVDEAAEQAERLVALNPQDFEARLELARLLHRLGHGEQAVLEARRILEVDPRSGGAHVIVGAVAAESGDLETALSHLRKAARGEDAAATEAARLLGRLLGQRGRYDEAAKALERAISLDPEDQDLRFAHATALLLAGHHATARRALVDGIQTLPTSAPLKHALARVLATAPDAETRDGRRALELAMQVFQAQPSIDHAETVAMALAELGRFDEAIEWQTRALQRARTVGRTESIPALETRLRRYRSGEPVREPWRR